MPVRFASWVGYDMDGRTDIGWSTSIRYRLLEKARRLTTYAASLRELEPAIAARLQRAADHTGAMAANFSADLSAPEALSTAANALRDEKLKVLKALKPVTGDSVANLTVRGQYRAGAASGGAVKG